MKKCLICEKGNLVKVEDITLELNGYIFIVKGERCTNCNVEIPYEEETRKTVSISRKLGVWPEPLKLYRHLSKSGGGLVFRVPGDLERQLKLKEKKHVVFKLAEMGFRVIR